MTLGPPSETEDISLFALGTLLLRDRWRIFRWMFVAGVIAGLMVFSRVPVYTATTSFAPQGYDPGRAGVAGLAGQFGVSLGGGNQTLSPDFYAKLLTSRVILQPIAHDTMTVTELGNKRVTFLDLYGITGGSPDFRDEGGVKELRGMIGIVIGKTTGIVEVSVASPWRSVSLSIATRLWKGLNEYNQRTRQSQAVSERKFVEGRLVIAKDELRGAEDRMEQFLRTNRDLGGSPELTIQRDRIQRDLTLKQQVFTSLTQAYEDARVREVRDTPVLAVVDEPFARTIPEPRGRLKAVLLAVLIAGLLRAMLTFAGGVIARRRAEDPNADHFVTGIQSLLGPVFKPLRTITARFSRPASKA